MYTVQSSMLQCQSVYPLARSPLLPVPRTKVGRAVLVLRSGRCKPCRGQVDAIAGTRSPQCCLNVRTRITPRCSPAYLCVSRGSETKRTPLVIRREQQLKKLKQDKKITNPNHTHYSTAEAANGVSGTSSVQGPTPATPRWEGDGTVDVKPISQAAASFLSQMRSEVAQVVEQSRKSTAASSKIQKSRAK